MSKLKKNIIYIIAAVIVVGIVIFSISKLSNNSFKKIDLDNYKNNNMVINTTNVAYLDTISYIGLDQMNVNNVNLMITKTNSEILKHLKNDIKTEAFINKNGNHSYSMYIDINSINSRNEYIKTISHELIHLNQYENGDLKALHHNIFVFKGDTVNANKINYNKRVWELEAYRKQYNLSDKIESIVW